MTAALTAEERQRRIHAVRQSMLVGCVPFMTNPASPERRSIGDSAIGILMEIADERGRQQSEEGYGGSHDDAHEFGELARAAAAYALSEAVTFLPPQSQFRRQIAKWIDLVSPWLECPKPHDRRRALVIAGALIVAELERLDRAAKAEETAS